jgi:hypothetical protein
MAKTNSQEIAALDEQDGISQRGRKRRRSPNSVTSPSELIHNPSSGSTTMRGRGRRRSTSDIGSQSESARKSSPAYTKPGWKYQKMLRKRGVGANKRSKSPSRSRTSDAQRTPRRRRRRTTSRSRSHGMERERREDLGANDGSERNEENS